LGTLFRLIDSHLRLGGGQHRMGTRCWPFFLLYPSIYLLQHGTSVSGE